MSLQRSSQREVNAQSRVKVGDICHSTAQGWDRCGDLVGLPAKIVTVLIILGKHEPVYVGI